MFTCGVSATRLPASELIGEASDLRAAGGIARTGVRSCIARGESATGSDMHTSRSSWKQAVGSFSELGTSDSTDMTTPANISQKLKCDTSTHTSEHSTCKQNSN